MKIYCSLKSTPELAGIEEAQRRKAWRNCCWKPYRHWEIWLCEIVLALLIFPSSYFLALWLDRILGAGFFLSLMICMLLPCVCNWFFFCTVYMGKMRPYLKEYLDEKKPFIV